jgi:hypothetical protein
MWNKLSKHTGGFKPIVWVASALEIARRLHERAVDEGGTE